MEKTISKNIPLNSIEIVSNTRTEFADNALRELAQSIKTNGVIEPVIVKPLDDGKFRLICGERRFRASLMIGKPDIPAFVKDIPDHKILQMQIVENLQRRGLSTMEEIRAIVSLRDEESMSEEEIGRAIGKHRSHIAAQIRISKAVPEVHDALEKNQITRQVALLIAALDTYEKQIEAVNALRRDKVARLIKAKDAEKWINNNFGIAPKKPAFGNMKKTGGRFASDWKYYLVRFSADQFARFKEVVRNRTETEVWSEAVEAVMLEAQEERSK